jgi:nicotinamidase-related amidase
VTDGLALDGAALILIDVQRGFDDPGWGTRNNAACEANIEALLSHWRARERPFYGEPDLHEWLQGSRIQRLVIAGITTNHCCETTARMAGNLGYEAFFALDATHTFDRRAPSGRTLSADELAETTATNLDGEFASVVTTRELLAG